MIIGIDEVGRGPWAGPLTVAAVGLETDVVIPGLTDSKIISASARKYLLPKIQVQAKLIHLSWVDASVIDKIGISEAMNRAVESLLQLMPKIPGLEIIIDGNINYGHNPFTRAVIGADKTFPAVSAASVVAKVRRDAYMERMALRFSNYGFEQHKGYGTAKHRLALEQFGPIKLHRRSYKPIKEFSK